MQQVGSTLWVNHHEPNQIHVHPAATCAEVQVVASECTICPVPDAEPSSSEMVAILGLSAKRRVLLEPDSLTDLRTGVAPGWGIDG